MPSILTAIPTAIIRHFKRRELNRTREHIAELNAMISRREITLSTNAEAVPILFVTQLENWTGTRASLVVLRDRLEKELGLSTTP